MTAPETSASSTAGLAVAGVAVSYAEAALLVDVDLRVGPTEVVALLGPSGSGKSSLLRVVAGLLVPDTGTVSWDGARPRSHTDAPTRLRAGLPGRLALPAPRRRGQRRVRPGGRGHAAGASGASASPSCSSWSSSLTTARARSPRCRAARPSGWPSPGRSPLDPGCSCSTNPSAPSTETCATGSRPTYGACSTGSAPRGSMSRTTSRRPSWSPTASCGSSRRAAGGSTLAPGAF